jgi:dihydrofolate reductase
MGKLVYSALMSLDGYIEDRDGRFDWAEPDEEVHGFVNDLERGIGTHLLGRRMYDVLAVWETMDAVPNQPAVIYDYAGIWRATDKVVYSRTLTAVRTARTRIEREFDAKAVRALKERSTGDLSIGGPELAAQAFKAALVDECCLFISPVAVGAGKAALPTDRPLELDLLEERRFGNGTVYLRYRVAT